MTTIVAGFVLGLTGSGHCVLMCGPLTLAMQRTSRFSPAKALTLHHAGRLAIYIAIGLAAGSAGHAAGLAGVGRVLAVMTGGLLIAQAVRRDATGAATRAGAAIGKRLAQVTSAVTHRIGPQPHLQALTLGAANGLLPCGMVYTALAAALALGDAVHGAAFMAAFGLGTLPALTATLAAPALARRFTGRLALVTRAAVLVLGAALVVQGLAPARSGSVSPTSHHQPGHSHLR